MDETRDCPRKYYFDLKVLKYGSSGTVLPTPLPSSLLFYLPSLSLALFFIYLFSNIHLQKQERNLLLTSEFIYTQHPKTKVISSGRRISTLTDLVLYNEKGVAGLVYQGKYPHFIIYLLYYLYYFILFYIILYYFILFYIMLFYIIFDRDKILAESLCGIRIG